MSCERAEITLCRTGSACVEHRYTMLKYSMTCHGMAWYEDIFIISSINNSNRIAA